jgi:hypothetical protein
MPSLRANSNSQPTTRQKIKYIKRNATTVKDARRQPPPRPTGSQVRSRPRGRILTPFTDLTGEDYEHMNKVVG